MDISNCLANPRKLSSFPASLEYFDIQHNLHVYSLLSKYKFVAIPLEKHVEN